MRRGDEEHRQDDRAHRKTRHQRSDRIERTQSENASLGCGIGAGTWRFRHRSLHPQRISRVHIGRPARRRRAHYCFTDYEALFRQLLLPGGVEPFLMPFSDDPEETILNAIEYLKRREWCAEGTWLVVITNALAHDKVIDTLQLQRIE